MVIRGRAIVLGDNVDTDVIIPSKYLIYTDPKVLGRHVFEGVDPSLPGRVREGDVVVAGRNFGCGSSREHAVLAILGSGVRAVLAESFARIFYRNAINRGLPVVEVPGIRGRVRDGDVVEVDLEGGRVRLPSGELLSFKPPSPEVMEIIRAGGLINYLKGRLRR